MSPLLRGEGETQVPYDQLYGLNEFISSSEDIPLHDREKFQNALIAQSNGKYETANNLYQQLLLTYQDNEIILFNISLMTK